MLVSLPLILILILQGMSPSQALLVVSAASENPVFRAAALPKDPGQRLVKSTRMVASRTFSLQAIAHDKGDDSLEGTATDILFTEPNAGFGFADRTRDGPAI